MRKYSAQYFGDFILCFFISSGLSVNVFAGYEMNDPWSGNPFAVAGTVILIMVILFSAYWSGKRLLISALTTAALLTASVGALYFTGAFTDISPVDENPILFWIIVITVSVIVFWLARTRAGIVVLFLSGTLMIAAFDLLKYPVSIWAYFVFLFCAFVMFLHRVYCIFTRKSDSGRNCFRAYFIQMMIVSLAAIVLAGGFYSAIIRPLSPPVDETELAKKLMSVQLLEKAGISSKVIASEKPDNTAGISNNSGQQAKEQEKEKDKKQKNHNEGGRIGKSDNLITVMAITYKKNEKKILIAIAALALTLICSLLLKCLLHRKWYRSLQRKSKEDGAMELYHYFIRRMRKAGFKRPDGITLLEYAYVSQVQMEKFCVYDASFLRLTQIYLKMLYGYQKISNEEKDLFCDFYSEFHKNLRIEMGRLRYCLHYFSI